MRLFLDTSTFISIITTESGNFSCQLMELVHGMGMYKASFLEKEKDDIVSCIIGESSFYRETSKICHSLEEICNFHQQCLEDLELKLEHDLNVLENQSTEQ